VPPSWPRAALEAQAIAARSYALATTGWEGAEGETLKTPICATTSCQGPPGAVAPRRRGGVRRRPAPVGRGASLRGSPRRHRLLLHLERPDVRERRGVRQRAPALPAPGGRTRRRRVARVALARPSAVRRRGDVPPRGRRVAT